MAEKTSDQMRRHNAHPNARKRRRLYMRSEKGKAANRKAQENYRSKHPEKVAAQQKARSSGSGAGHRCRCGKPATHKHHTDYGKGKIAWLCHTCHVKAHHPKSNLGKADKLPGGLADNKKPSDFPAAALRQGIKVESEHTKDRALAQEIAMDHLTEDPKYYTKLKRVEGDVKKTLVMKAIEPQAKPGQTGKYVGEAPTKPTPPAAPAGRVDKAEPLAKPSNVVHGKQDEAKWNRAKAAAKKQGQEGNYRLVMHIYQNMKKASLTEALLEKSFQDLVPKAFDREVLEKSLSGGDWHERFRFSPLEAAALKIEEDYQRACHELEKQHEANRKARDAAHKKLAKLVDQEAPYFDFYDKKHALREKYAVKKRELLLKLLAHQRKEAEARKSLVKAETPATLQKSRQEGPMSDHTLTDIYAEIRGRNVDHELAKSEKAEKTGDPDPEKVDKGEVPMTSEAIGKSMNSVGHGEQTGQLGSPSANGTVAGGGGASGGQKFDSESKTGMPSNGGEYSTEQWSADDVAVEQQLKDGGMKPLERVVPNGSADLGQNATMNAPGTIHKSGGAMEGAQGFQMSEAYAKQIGAMDHRGVGVGVPRPVEQVEKSETPVHYWSNGLALYSDGEDQQISKAMNEQGYIVAEPTLGIPNSPLTKGHTCINQLCKSSMPSFITVCPGCGTDQTGQGYPAPHGSVVMEKSVAARLRPSGGGDLSLPNGIVLTPKE